MYLVQISRIPPANISRETTQSSRNGKQKPIDILNFKENNSRDLLSLPHGTVTNYKKKPGPGTLVKAPPTIHQCLHLHGVRQWKSVAARPMEYDFILLRWTMWYYIYMQGSSFCLKFKVHVMWCVPLISVVGWGAGKFHTEGMHYQDSLEASSLQ